MKLPYLVGDIDEIYLPNRKPAAGGPGIPPTLHQLLVPIKSVTPWPQNYNNGDLDKIEESLRQHGQFRPIVCWLADASPYMILMGNHTYMAALKLGWEYIAVTFVDATRKAAEKMAVADNRIPQLARPDDGLLAELLQGFDTLDGTGFDERSLNELLDRVNDNETQTGGDGEKEYNPDAVIKYVLIFEDLDQQNNWFAWLKQLRKRYPGDDVTIAARIDRALREGMGE